MCAKRATTVSEASHNREHNRERSEPQRNTHLLGSCFARSAPRRFAPPLARSLTWGANRSYNNIVITEKSLQARFAECLFKLVLVRPRWAGNLRRAK